MVEFHKEIVVALNAIPGNQGLVRMFLSGGNAFQRYVIGRNDQAAELIKVVGIDGVVDDFDVSGSAWKGVPIIASKNLPDNSIVVNCSTSISPNTVYQKLQSLGVERVLGFHEVMYAAAKVLSMPWFVEQMRRDYKEYSSEWFDLYRSMADDQSRKTLLDVIRFRLTADSKYMRGYTTRLKDQYFEDFVEVTDDIFVDIGGFDGDTTGEFCKRYPEFKKVYFFEPSILNMNKARSILQGHRDIEYIPMGLSDEVGRLFFNDGAGSASSVANSGDISVDVSTLDAYIDEPVDFIKIDIEGWELKALAGSKRHIKNDHPKMAIAVYHSAMDFREIPRLILSINPEYKIYLRHYTEGWSETVMYFIPAASKNSPNK